MLDSDTKRRIDTARDILVGKVPDPKSQVEQITIALIYKFMDDMDASAEELGGKRKFFANSKAGDFGRYGWAKLMRSGLGGHETLNLYAEALTKMPENPGIPTLFRDIFKNAYLPYRDPETLKSFLKVIDEFEYDHSERLGDAFEYLLSVLGSQGDAGQFRTPRHIIDFIVKIVDPKKNETILDPACGTAGFLISAWKHINKANTKDGHTALTPDERKQLAAGITGYDISPDMVRLSRANMYLHGFADPHIHEYDTLTSLEKWNETADVILANAPFMSPKGGIKPHNRFGVQSKRSEVLFVDYMAEHLTPNGRAGIIVPEGIIFQSQGAYTDLRKMLVNEYLVAVISLPAGVFNPYSGVKTSILILDRSLAKLSQTIGFFKVENDGYGLGAQRREVKGEQLSQVAMEIVEYLSRVRARKAVEDFLPTLGLIVLKAKIAENGEYNLSGERYRENGARTNAFPLVRIREVCTINPQKSEVADLPPDMRVSFVPMADLAENRIAFVPHDQKSLSEVGASYTYFRDGDVLVAKVTPCFENGKAGLARGLLNGIGFGSSEFYVLRPKEPLLAAWLYFCVTHPLFREPAIAQMTGTGGLQRVPRGYVEEFEIPLPPLEVQREIVAEIEGFQRVIDGARAVLDHYRPHIAIRPEWPMVELGEIAEIQFGKMLDRNKHTTGRLLPYLRNISVRWGAIETHDLPEMYFEDNELDRFGLRAGDVVVCEGGSYPGRAAVWDGRIPNMKFQKALHRVRFKVPYEAQLLVEYLRMIDGTLALESHFSGSTIKHLTGESFGRLRIPLPPLEVQRNIVAEIEAERRLVAANRELVARFEKKIQAAIARVWGEEPVPAPIASLDGAATPEAEA